MCKNVLYPPSIWVVLTIFKLFNLLYTDFFDNSTISSTSKRSVAPSTSLHDSSVNSSTSVNDSSVNSNNSENEEMSVDPDEAAYRSAVGEEYSESTGSDDDEEIEVDKSGYVSASSHGASSEPADDDADVEVDWNVYESAKEDGTLDGDPEGSSE